MSEYDKELQTGTDAYEKAIEPLGREEDRRGDEKREGGEAATRPVPPRDDERGGRGNGR